MDSRRIVVVRYRFPDKIHVTTSYSDILRQLTGKYQGTDGVLFENYAVMELHKLVRSLYPQTRLWFYRTRSGLEVDLLCETGGGFVGLEVKSSGVVSGNDFRALRHLAEALGEKMAGGIVIYRGDKILQYGPKLWAVPSYRLFSPA